jgi:hypothetical protein
MNLLLVVVYSILCQQFPTNCLYFFLVNEGTVKLIFQPAEEGFGGAREMIKDGCLEDCQGPRVDEIYGIHLWSCKLIDLSRFCHFMNSIVLTFTS